MSSYDTPETNQNDTEHCTTSKDKNACYAATIPEYMRWNHSYTVSFFTETCENLTDKSMVSVRNCYGGYLDFLKNELRLNYENEIAGNYPSQGGDGLATYHKGAVDLLPSLLSALDSYVVKKCEMIPLLEAGGYGSITCGMDVYIAANREF